MGASSANRPVGEGGRQYHLGMGPGDVAPWIILVGDPARARRAAARLDQVRVERSHREFVGFTGPWGALEVTLLATGMGCDNTEIAVLELLQCERQPVFIRVGSCGALQPEMALGSLVISSGALRLENTSLGFVEPGFPALAHHEVILALLSAARASGAPHRLGITATAPGFYGWQGRKEQLIPPRDPDLPARLQRQGVANFEMETSTLLTLATLAGVRAGSVCAVFANRPANTFIAPKERVPAEDRALDVAFEALRLLAAMDAAAGDAPYTLKLE